jgi:NAD(P)-dependent dehydrogenase (short-subunit alcohol dehydrogenase family)
VGLAPDAGAAVASVVGQTPLGRLGEVGDMGDAAAFLCSNEARFVTSVGLRSTAKWARKSLKRKEIREERT